MISCHILSYHTPSHHITLYHIILHRKTSFHAHHNITRRLLSPYVLTFCIHFRGLLVCKSIPEIEIMFGELWYWIGQGSNWAIVHE